MGCEGSFPYDVVAEQDVSWPYGDKNPKEFIAAFSNIGKEIDVTALGVGVLSILPRNSFGACSGTSMAAPIVTGAAACLLSRNRDLYNMPRTRERSDAMVKLLCDSCTPRGFGSEFEGHGMPDPEKV